MQYNCTFTTYRRETSGTKRQYAAGATITNGSGYYQPAGAELSAVLGLGMAVKIYTLLTQETNLQIGDKVIISGSNYYIEGLEQQEVNSTKLSRALLLLKE